MIEPISVLRDRATRATLPGQDAIWPSVFERYIESMNAKDLAGVIGLYHDGSPYRELEKQRLAHLFSNLDCTGELLAVRHVGQDGEFVEAASNHPSWRSAGTAMRGRSGP